MTTDGAAAPRPCLGPSSVTALVLPGQGSQRPGAGAPWRRFPAWSLVERGSDLLDRDLAHLLLDADADQLRRTGEAQLATFLVSLLAWRSLPDLDVAVVAGHSLGELTALVVDEVCGQLDGAWPASFNAPAHVVVSGTVEGVAAVGAALRAGGARRRCRCCRP